MLHVVRIETDAAGAPLVEAGLELAGYDAASWQNADTGATRFECYYSARGEAELDAAALTHGLRAWLEPAGWSLAVVDLADADWQEAWKHFFRAERVSPNVQVRPPWEAGDPGMRCVVEIDPGLSFGTGRHFTTRTCLQLLDGLQTRQPGGAMLDVGCGSGILAIAATKLGFAPVVAFDNDPQAIVSASGNVVRNGVDGRMQLMVAGVETYRPERAYDVVVANLFDGLLRGCAPAIIGFLAPGPGSRLILSGMLRAQVPAVRAVYVARGFLVEDLLEDHEWATLLLRRGAS